MIFAVVISFLLTSGLALPVEKRENGLEKTTSQKAEEESIPVTMMLVVPEQPAFREEGDEKMKMSLEGGVPMPVSEQRAAKEYSYNAPYPSSGPAFKPMKPVGGSNVMATFTASVSPSAIPILLSCAPKVITGTLEENLHPAPLSHPPTYSQQPAYRNVFSDLSDLLTPNNSGNDFNLSDILDLDSPASVISSGGDDDRKKRSSWADSGATRYKVSEDYPEARLGNHHLVSDDYPRPNMMKFTPNQI